MSFLLIVGGENTNSFASLVHGENIELDTDLAMQIAFHTTDDKAFHTVSINGEGPLAINGRTMFIESLTTLFIQKVVEGGLLSYTMPNNTHCQGTCSAPGLMVANDKLWFFFRFHPGQSTVIEFNFSILDQSEFRAVVMPGGVGANTIFGDFQPIPTKPVTGRTGWWPWNWRLWDVK